MCLSLADCIRQVSLDCDVVIPYTQRERGKVTGVGVHIYVYNIICICFCGPKYFLNHTLAINSPFQTFTVELLIKFID